MPSNIKEVRQIKDFLPLVMDGKQVGLLPLSGMSTVEIASKLPGIKVVETTENLNVRVVQVDNHPDFEESQKVKDMQVLLDNADDEEDFIFE